MWRLRHWLGRHDPVLEHESQRYWNLVLWKIRCPTCGHIVRHGRYYDFSPREHA